MERVQESLRVSLGILMLLTRNRISCTLRLLRTIKGVVWGIKQLLLQVAVVAHNPLFLINNNHFNLLLNKWGIFRSCSNNSNNSITKHNRTCWTSKISNRQSCRIHSHRSTESNSTLRRISIIIQSHWQISQIVSYHPQSWNNSTTIPIAITRERINFQCSTVQVQTQDNHKCNMLEQESQQDSAVKLWWILSIRVGFYLLNSIRVMAHCIRAVLMRCTTTITRILRMKITVFRIRMGHQTCWSRIMTSCSFRHRINRSNNNNNNNTINLRRSLCNHNGTVILRIRVWAR